MKKGIDFYYLHSIIFVILIFGIGFLPPIGGITEMGMRVLGVFIGLLYGWIFIGFIWTSLFGMLALGLTGYDSIINVFSAGFGNATVLKVFFIFVFAGILQATDLTTYIANWCVSRKICRGRPWVLIICIFITSVILGGFINQYAGIVIIWYIFYGICKTVGLKKGDALVSYVIVGVPVMCTMGAMMLPFLPVSVIFRSMLQENILTTYAMPSGTLLLAHLLLTWTLVIGYILLGKYILRINTDALKNLNKNYFDDIANMKMKPEQKISMITLVLFVAILVAPLLLPAGIVKATLSNIDILGAAVIMIIFFCFRKNANREYIYDFGTMVFKGINWDIIILFAATMPVSSAMESDATGIITTIVGSLMPIFTQISPTMYLAVCAIIILMITQVAHNLILGIVFTSVLATIGINMGINPYLFQIFFAWMLQLAFMTPGASANSALIFANSEWISTKDAYKYTTTIVVCGGVIAFAVLPVLVAMF